MSWLELSSTIMVAVFGSSGLWAFIASRRRKDDATTTMMKGIAYNAILSEARFMIDQATQLQRNIVMCICTFTSLTRLSAEMVPPNGSCKNLGVYQ